MKLTDTMDYCRLLSMFNNPLYYQAIGSTKFYKPGIDFEGMAGYIEVNVEFEVIDIEAFAALWKQGYSDENREECLNIRSKLIQRPFCKS